MSQNPPLKLRSAGACKVLEPFCLLLPLQPFSRNSQTGNSSRPSSLFSPVRRKLSLLLQNRGYMMADTQHIEAMKLLLQSAKYSDLTLVCRGREFPVHRAIVCPHSPFLDAACSSGFQVSTGSLSAYKLRRKLMACVRRPIRGE